jgi:hypothetical protein
MPMVAVHELFCILLFLLSTYFKGTVSRGAQTKHPEGQNVLRPNVWRHNACGTKCLEGPKTSGGKNIWRDKMSGGQNVQRDKTFGDKASVRGKHLEGQNVRKDQSFGKKKSFRDIFNVHIKKFKNKTELNCFTVYYIANLYRES